MSTKSWPRTCHSSCVTARAVRPCNPIWLHHITGCFFPHSSLSPPFHHATACPTNTGRYAMVPAAIKRSKTREVRVTGGRTPRFSRTNAERAWGSPWVRREPPESWVEGCKTSRGKGDATHDVGFQSPTIYTYTFQDLLHFHQETWVKKKKVLKVRDCSSKSDKTTHQDEIQVEPIQYVQNDLGIPTCPHHKFGT